MCCRGRGGVGGGAEVESWGREEGLLNFGQLAIGGLGSEGGG